MSRVWSAEDTPSGVGWVESGVHRVPQGDHVERARYSGSRSRRFDALFIQDCYLAGAIVLVLSTLTVVRGLISDILLALADSRIDLERVRQ